MSDLTSQFEWAGTPLGDPAGWPASLQSMVAMMLNSPLGIYIAWGSEFIQLYNDAFRPILGATKHPQALGTSSRETFAEIWDTIGPMFESVMKGNT